MHEKSILQKELDLSQSQLSELHVEAEKKKQWETYLGNIVQWVYDEKDARSYLETLATKMSEELEALRVAKQAQIPLQVHLQSSRDNDKENEKGKWQTLRQNKVKQQQILELQRWEKPACCCSRKLCYLNV